MMTEPERLQAEIEAWTLIRNTAWNQFLTAVCRLAQLGVKQNLCDFLKKLDKLRKNDYAD
jgi:hypothetical protein